MLTVALLYPELLGLYGDRGNALVLLQRARWRGLPIRLRSLSLHDTIDPQELDILLIGGGQDRDQSLVSAALVRQAPALRELIAAAVPVLAVCGGYQLLGHSYRDASGRVSPGAGLLDLETVAGRGRLIGNAVVEVHLDGCRRRLVGFENHLGRTRLGAGLRPFGRVLIGHGNDGRSGWEGCWAGAVIGTYLHGPLLPRNPWLADHLLSLACRHRGLHPVLAPLEDRLELQAHRLAEQVAARQWRHLGLR